MKNKDEKKVIPFLPSAGIAGIDVTEGHLDLVAAVEANERKNSLRRRRLGQKKRREYSAKLRKIFEADVPTRAEIRKVVGNDGLMIAALLPSPSALDHSVYLLEDALKRLRRSQSALKRRLREHPDWSGFELRRQLVRTVKAVREISLQSAYTADVLGVRII